MSSTSKRRPSVHVRTSSNKKRRRSLTVDTPTKRLARIDVDERNIDIGSDTPSDSRGSLFTDRQSSSPAKSQISSTINGKLPGGYAVLADEIEEDENLVIIGEDPPLTEDDDTLPIRLFTHFTIYHKETKQLVDIADLISERDAPGMRPYRASGFVKPWTEDESDLDEVIEAVSDQGQYIQLGRIRHLNIFHCTKGNIDSKIYLETEHGWYILEDPSTAYSQFFQNFWYKHRVTYLVVSESLKNSSLDKDRFLDSLTLHDEYSSRVLQRLKDGIDDEDVRAFALGTILELPIDITRVPLICQIFGEIQHFDVEEDEIGPFLAVRDAKSKTVVTPAVLQLCDIDHPTRFHQPYKTEVHSEDPQVTWQTKSPVRNYYTSVAIDSTTYSVGDVVIVERGEDSNASRDRNARETFSRSINSLANSKWFAKISYMFEDKNQKWFHAQWYQHGSQTVLQEAAHPSVLFSMLECNDLLLESIVMKCNLANLEHGDDSSLPDYDPRNENNFFCGLTWDEHRSAFVELPKSQVDRALGYCEAHKRCMSCGVKAEREEFKTPQVVAGDLYFLGLVFRRYDFAYVVDNREGDLYTIGQILYIGANLMLALRVYERSANVKRPFDELLLKSSDKILTIPALQIEGLCWAKLESEISSENQKVSWLSKEDHFLIVEPDKGPVNVDRIGLHLHEKELIQKQALYKSNEPLRGMELFAGAGGFGTGLNLSGFIKTLWAVEWDSSAAATYNENHYETRVFNHDSNVFLTYAIEGKPLECVDRDTTSLQPLPKPGEVDIIYGGPPCQAFSGMNHHRDPNDSRVTLVCNMISYVEYYRPKYFMLENVERMLDYPLGAQLNGRSFEGGIKKGVLKFILSALTSLGYQVHFKVLQAGRYGVPQNRERVIFLASKRGFTLLHFPLPTHVFSRRATTKNLANGERLDPVSRMGENSEDHVCLCAPMAPVVFDDFVGDLPQFDWKNPHILRRKHDPSEAQRLNAGIKVFDVLDSPDESIVGYIRPKSYLHPPMNLYQARARDGVEDGKVTLHYTRRYRANVVERVVNLPLTPDADHSDLPKELQIVEKLVKEKAGGKQPRYKNTYRRFNGSRHVDTLMTQPNPTSVIKAIHPHEKRTLTVREYARLQGFPDSYRFIADDKKSEVTQQFKQIGNAVPVPLALALGRAIGEVVLQSWQQQGSEKGRAKNARNGSPEL